MRRWVLVGGAIAVVIILIAATLRLFVWPPTSSVPREADAVALLSGGSGDRLPTAVGLVRRGVAPVLVIPNGHDPKWLAANRLCDRPQPFRVVCPAPNIDTTRGEAELLGRMARELSWRRVVVVTSRYHVTRGGILVRRCLPVPTAMLASNPEDSLVTWTRHVVHEWIGLGPAVVLHRSC